MATNIEIIDPFAATTKFSLIEKFTVGEEEVNGAIFIPDEDGIITISNDGTLRVWLKRDTGKYWPSIVQSTSYKILSLSFVPSNHNIVIGLDNGYITQYHIEDDYNSLIQMRSIQNHVGGVVALHLFSSQDWIVSTSHDKTTQLSCTQSGLRLHSHSLAAAGTCLVVDEPSNYIFVGDYFGRITLLHIDKDSHQFEVIRTLDNSGFGGMAALSNLTWNGKKQLLFSTTSVGSTSTVKVWDIGGGEGKFYLLNGHFDKVKAIISVEDFLISGSNDGMLVFWDMKANRHQPPEWVSSDKCQLCDSPFFWNIRSMIERRQFSGLRQHHCRKCGKATCDSCSSTRQALPSFGFETEVRVCTECHNHQQQNSTLSKALSVSSSQSSSNVNRKSLALFHDAKHAIKCIDFITLVNGKNPNRSNSKHHYQHGGNRNTPKSLFLTVGRDRVCKIWKYVV